MISIRMLKMSGDAIINLFSKYSKIAENLEYFQMNGKKKTSYQFLKKATSKTSKTIAQLLFFQSVARFLNVSCTLTC